jgi:uncharacterized membrane protein YeaQ/YmgE (transglycosylase-associated protein family)
MDAMDWILIGIVAGMLAVSLFVKPPEDDDDDH